MPRTWWRRCVSIGVCVCVCICEWVPSLYFLCVVSVCNHCVSLYVQYLAVCLSCSVYVCDFAGVHFYVYIQLCVCMYSVWFVCLCICVLSVYTSMCRCVPVCTSMCAFGGIFVCFSVSDLCFCLCVCPYTFLPRHLAVTLWEDSGKCVADRSTCCGGVFVKGVQLTSWFSFA